VDRARAGGQEVSFSLEGLAAEELEELGRGTVVALARILAEALTNAAKHAPGRPVTALLARREGQVVLTVGNPLADARDTSVGAADRAGTARDGAPSTGHGLIGVEERAHLLGGGARWHRDAERFEVEAWLPW
jgi:signal transduction histidine kinase